MWIRLTKIPRPYLFALIGVALLLTILMQLVGAPLTTAAAPAGIVSFEFAGTVARAQEILASWDRQAQLHAAFSLGLDYVYLLAYALAIGLTCLRLAASWETARPGLARLGRLLGWSQGVAALLDAVENVALIRLLIGSPHALWPPLAWICAALKFALVLAGLAYVLVAATLPLLSPPPE